MSNKSLRKFIYVLVIFVGLIFSLNQMESLKEDESIDSLSIHNIPELLYENEGIAKGENSNLIAKDNIAAGGGIVSLQSYNKGPDIIRISASGRTFKYPKISSTAEMDLDRAKRAAFDYSKAVSIESLGGSTDSTGKAAYVSVRNGTHFIWLYLVDSSSRVSASGTVTQSCTNQIKRNVKGKSTVERCFVKRSNGSIKPDIEEKVSIAECASGYEIERNSVKTITYDCPNKQMSFGLNRRFCKQVISFNCVKKNGGSTVPAAYLSSLSVSGGSLSPKFKTSTKKYTVTVNSDVSSVRVNAGVKNGSFVNGYGPRSVNLKYGSNNVSLKVKNKAGKVSTYSVNIIRKDGRSDVNTLSNITLNYGQLTPAFKSDVVNYSVNVPNNVTSIKVDAILTDKTSAFEPGFGPGTYPLQAGTTKITIKVKSQRGNVKVYLINVTKDNLSGECAQPTDTMARIKRVEFKFTNKEIQIDPIEEFDAAFQAVVEVPYDVRNLDLNVLVLEDGDTYKVSNAEDLEVNVPKQVEIVVTSAKCPNVTNTYILNVTRQEEVILDSNAMLEELKAEGYDLNYSPEKITYKINPLKKKDVNKSLKIDYKPQNPNTKCNIAGNEKLNVGSIITITCIAQNKEKIEYTISIDKVEKGMNIFFVVILGALVLFIIIYVILRLLGYRIYFNFEVIGAFFRGIGEKISNIFDK